jgi:hypothetical protein
MKSRSRGQPRLRTCSECGVTEHVRCDNLSKRCRRCAARASGMRGIESRRSRRLLTQCECCGAQFPTTASAQARGADRYCSRDCLERARRVDRTCKFCGTTFSVPRSVLSSRTNSAGNFCSKSCYHSHLCRTERVTGRGSRWRAARTGALRRAPFCAVCGTLSRLDVHHIIPFRLTHDNDQTNLVPLCKKHHKVVETIFLELENVETDLRRLQFWFLNVLGEHQSATRSLLLELVRTNR